MRQHFLLNKMKTGRPKLAASEKKGQITGVRLRSGERALVEKAARLNERKLSDWVRNTLVDAASIQVRSIAGIDADSYLLNKGS